MNRKTVLVAVLAIVLFSATAFYTQKMYEGKVSVIARSLSGNIFKFMTSSAASDKSLDSDVAKLELQDICSFTEPESRLYDAEFLGIHTPVTVSKGEVFKTVISFRNTGNVPLFSGEPDCTDKPILNLGTSQPKDRSSLFMMESPEFDSHWTGPNRIKLTTPRVDPGKIGYFDFWSTAPDEDEIFVEHFTPVVEGIKWLDNARTSVTIRSGVFDLELEKKIPFALRTRRLSDFDISAEKNIVVDVSDQTMNIQIGDDVLNTFPVSTGAYSTPTPYGKMKISFKQEVRVAGKWPHYIMPKFMWFRAGGYGIHALPSLKTDGGKFWNEARTNIQRRVSHGCIRLLPEDANIVYDFSEAGTPITIQR